MTPLKTRTAHGGVGKRVEARDAVGPSQWVVCLGGSSHFGRRHLPKAREPWGGDAGDAGRAGGCVREGVGQILGVRILFLMCFGIL